MSDVPHIIFKLAIHFNNSIVSGVFSSSPAPFCVLFLLLFLFPSSFSSLTPPLILLSFLLLLFLSSFSSQSPISGAICVAETLTTFSLIFFLTCSNSDWPSFCSVPVSLLSVSSTVRTFATVSAVPLCFCLNSVCVLVYFPVLNRVARLP